MDYRNLLKKYISLIARREGTDFIDSFYRNTELNLSAEEWKELCNLSDEAEEELYEKK